MTDTKQGGATLGQGTRIVHAGRDPFAYHGFVNPPVYRGSTVLFPDLDTLESGKQTYTYGRKGSPTMKALEEALCELEGGHRTVLAPSGLGAVTTALLAFARSGDHILVVDTCYRPTRQFCDQVLKGLGVEVTYFDPLIGAGIEALLQPNTRIVYTESPGSQTFEMQDIPAIVEVAHARGLVVMMDNTWATPLFFDAHEYGVDYSIQAGTKYLAGHSDVLIGTVSARTPEQYKTLRDSWSALGVTVGSDDAFLTLRGSRTMSVRLLEQQKAGLDMALWLQSRPEVARVHYPALPDDPGHKLWKRDFTGASSLFSITLKPASMNAVAAMIDGLELFGIGASWGGFESLALPFDCKAYRTATKWEPEGPTIRFHIGLEDREDLKADLDAGFARLRKAS